MFLCLSNAKHPTASSEIKKAYIFLKLKTTYANEEQKTILSQVNTFQNLRKTTGNTYSRFQPLASIITEGLDNIQINESNNYLREETKKSVKKTQQKIKQINSAYPSKRQSSRKVEQEFIVELKPDIH